MRVMLYAMFGYTGFVAVIALLAVWLRALQLPDAHAAWFPALAVDLGLMLLFAVQHTVMARAGFKRWIEARIPSAAERATYVIAANLALLLMILGWQRLPGMVWQFGGPAAWMVLVIAAGGGVLAVLATFQFDHLALFGLRQALDHWRQRPAAVDGFSVPWLYRGMRHPMLTGTLVAIWATPQLSVDRLVFGLGFTLYMLVGIRFEERSLRRRFGAAYEDYAAVTPALLPWPRPRRATAVTA